MLRLVGFWTRGCAWLWGFCTNSLLSRRYSGPTFQSELEPTLSVARIKRGTVPQLISWSGHGCSVGMDGVCDDVIMVGTRMLCGNGWSLCGRYHGWLGHGCSVGMDGVCVDVIMIGTRMLCGNGWSLCARHHGWDMDAL